MKTETIVQLPIVKKDPWLEPNAEDMLRRYDRYRERLSAIVPAAFVAILLNVLLPKDDKAA